MVRVSRLTLQEPMAKDSPSSKTPSFPSLSRRERELLEIIHRLEAPTLTEIIEEISNPPVRAAVRTLLNVMERKGHIRHDKRGREFVYHATRSREMEGGSSLRRLLSTFFKGSLKDAISCHFAESPKELKESEIEELSDLLKQLRKESNTKPPGK